jgi:hypothetical protein
MANVSLWSNVAVAIQSALAAAVTINSISKASTGVVGYTGTDPSNGDYILLTVQGMHQVDGRIFRVANVNGAGNTLELEGENTTNYDTFTSGTFEVITFGTTLATATSLSASGGDFEFVDTTTIHEAVRTQVPGVAAPAVYSFENIWDVADAGLVALKQASDLKAKRAVRITFANAQKVLFNGYVGATLLPVGSAQDKVITPTVITMHGRPTTYAT